MCKVLKLSRSSFYYNPIPKEIDSEFENAVIDEFHKSRNNYGTRKLKIVLARCGIYASKRRIGKVMKKYDLVSNYTLKLKKTKKHNVNNDDISNIVNRDFDNRKPLEVVVSDLTYVRVDGKWNYICVLLDLSNRQIIGSAVGKSKSAQIVKSAFFTVKSDLRKIKIVRFISVQLTISDSEIVKSKIDWKQKLSSRKFWAAIVGFITPLLIVFNVNGGFFVCGDNSY